MARLSQPGRGANLLDDVPLFSGLTQDLRGALAAVARTVELPAGEWLFREGDPAVSLFVVASGRLEVVVEEPQFQVLRVLGRGAAVGELALLTGKPRSASVRARRDSDLLEIAEQDFAQLLTNNSDFALALTRALGEQLQASRSLMLDSMPRPATIVLVPLEPGLAVAELGGALRRELSRGQRVALLPDDAPGEGSRSDLLDRFERESEQVLLVADEPPAPGASDWTGFCMRQADRILGITRGGPLPDWLDQKELHGCDLVFTEEAQPSSLVPWRDTLGARAVHLLGPDGPARIARRLAGRSVGVVLSGGGARGFAHVGALEEFEAAGLVVDRIGGCSIGSFVGGLYARGWSPDRIFTHMIEEFVEKRPLGDYTIPLVALLRGERGRDLIERSFGSLQIEELGREFFCVSCDLLTSEFVVHRSGPAYVAIGASMALPGITPPVPDGRRLLVDGGVLNNLPVEDMTVRGEGPVIAIDITARFEPPTEPRNATSILARTRLFERTRSAVLGVGAYSPLRSKEILFRTVTLGSSDTSASAQAHADLIIEPEVGGVGLLEWRAYERTREAGRVAAHAALEQHRELIADWASG